MKYDSIAKDCNFAVPKLTDYEKYKLKEELEKLSAPRGGFEGKYKGSSGILLATFAAEVFLRKDTQDHLF